MNPLIFTGTYPSMPVNVDEVLRYAGSAGGGADLRVMVEDCVREAGAGVVGRVCWMELSLVEGDAPPAFLTGSRSLERHLTGCDHVLLFAATVGIGLDRLTAKYSRLAPSRAVLFQALGTERIESLCDLFCEDMGRRITGELRPRYSPGYGDWSLQAQRDIFRILSPYRHIGLSLNESLLMSPTKSVTAVIGIDRKRQNG